MGKDKGWDEPFINMDDNILLEIIKYIYKDYKLAIDTLIESIYLLAHEVTLLQAAPPYPDTPTPIPFCLTDTKVTGTTAGPSYQPPTNHQSHGPKASWATVARRRGKKRNTNQAGVASAQPKPTATAKP